MATLAGSQQPQAGNVKVFDERMKEVEGLSPAGPDNEAAQAERRKALSAFYKPFKATTAKLPNGEIPLLGLGTWCVDWIGWADMHDLHAPGMLAYESQLR
jgi:hypothetical protein